MRTKTLDNSTLAALPGALTLSAAKYNEYFSRNPLITALASSLPWTFRILPGIGNHIVHWTKTKEHLQSGCLNPAIIISSSSSLVAAFTNLSAAGERSFPYIKIFKERIDLISPKYRANQAYLATASVYYRTQESRSEGRWSDFHPIVVNCLVDGDTGCDEARSRLKPLAWKALEMGLESINQLSEGLHPVDVPHEIVWNAY